MTHKLRFRKIRFSGYQLFTLCLIGTLMACSKNETLNELSALSPSNITALGNEISLNNPGFEADFDSWTDIDPSAISGDARSGSKSAKITGSAGKVTQTVSLSQNTDYQLSAWILGQGKIGVTNGNDAFETTAASDDWTQYKVDFNSGNSTSITIYAAYGGGEGRFDDFSLFEGADSSPQDPSDTTTVQYDIVAVTASAHDGNLPENTIDGNLSTRWSANGSGQYITFDLGSEKSVNEVKAAWYNGDSRTSGFSISLGSDPATLTEVYSGTSSGQTNALESYSFPEAFARYIRITGYGNSSNSWNSISEVEIYLSGTGEDNGGEPGDGNEEAPGTAQIPSDLMSNCNQWKITYPDGSEDKTLCGEANNEYWFVNEDKNAMVFRAPIRSNNGTTPNSSYVRSELRERKEDGSSDIYWTTTGTHVVYVKQAITHLPIVKDHLVATQIHGDKSAGIDDAMVMRLEGNHLFASFNGGKLRSDLTIKTNYNLGTVHEVIFEVINGKHYLYYSEDGKLAEAYANGSAAAYLIKDGGNDYVMDLNYDQSYFKIGNYTQSNADKEGSYTGDPNNYGEVVVYDYFVSHQ
ncbi:hypothetical protein PEDI_12600 [Persicobacter diffluens]|uniref:F5/8 type C domain-containing protein n=1 Tax=Persicobacter diffluens TaxID=981 RepID=A0AAN4VXE3_9BACT|nr:hypothetical protein PEDI_12600 [Persicobacter diffluens]